MTVGPPEVPAYLGPRRFHSEMDALVTRPGVAVGLAWTPTGGDVLLIEAVKLRGRGELKLTGRLGEVMAESAHIARSVVRSRAVDLGIDENVFRDFDLHLHVPAGAVPKDGPSAGVAMVMSMASLFSGKTIRGDVGMTGEVTLRGRVLPVGGIKMKVLAAHRAGLTTVILPKRNEKDLEEIPQEVRDALRIVPVERIDEAMNVAFGVDARQEINMAT